MVPNLFGARDQFHGRQFSRDLGWLRDDPNALHLLCTLFLLLFPQLHLGSSGIRSWRLGTHALKCYKNKEKCRRNIFFKNLLLYNKLSQNLAVIYYFTVSQSQECGSELLSWLRISHKVEIKRSVRPVVLWNLQDLLPRRFIHIADRKGSQFPDKWTFPWGCWVYHFTTKQLLPPEWVIWEQGENCDAFYDLSLRSNMITSTMFYSLKASH